MSWFFFVEIPSEILTRIANKSRRQSRINLLRHLYSFIFLFGTNSSRNHGRNPESLEGMFLGITARIPEGMSNRIPKRILLRFHKAIPAETYVEIPGEILTEIPEEISEGILGRICNGTGMALRKGFLKVFRENLISSSSLP